MSYTNVQLTNGVFDNWYMTHDVTSSYTEVIPTDWDVYTIMNANFEGNIDAGNLDASLLTIDGFKIKRRKADEFDWIELAYIPIESMTDFSFTYEDNFAQNITDYEYAIVPITSGAEGTYITNTIESKFNGVFICDKDRTYRLYSGVSYGSMSTVQKVGVFEPYGRKYPVIVANGTVSYNTGSISGRILNNDYLKTKVLDSKAIVKERKELLNFLTNKKAKVIKDWNSNIWLVMITGNPTTTFDSNSSMEIASVSANWTEIGDVNNQKDLIMAGMIEDIV